MGGSFGQALIYLTDHEFHEFISELANVFRKVIEKELTSDRKARHISTIILPDIKNSFTSFKYSL